MEQSRNLTWSFSLFVGACKFRLPCFRNESVGGQEPPSAPWLSINTRRESQVVQRAQKGPAECIIETPKARKWKSRRAMQRARGN